MYGGDRGEAAARAATPSPGVSARRAAWHTRLPTTLNPRRPSRRRLKHEAGIKRGTVQAAGGAEDWRPNFGAPGRFVAGVVGADEEVLANRAHRRRSRVGRRGWPGRRRPGRSRDTSRRAPRWPVRRRSTTQFGEASGASDVAGGRGRKRSPARRSLAIKLVGEDAPGRAADARALSR